MPKKLPVKNQDDWDDGDGLLDVVSRLAALHREIRAEQHFCQSVDLEGISALLSLCLLPLESAIIDAGRLDAGKPPLVISRT